jgi:hypothetical protein
MTNNKVIALPPSLNSTPEQALLSALDAELTDVMIIGYDESGSLYIRSSKMTRAEGLFMAKNAEYWAMGMGGVDD